ncbi:MAG: DnaJ like chaperone protein [Flavobacterium sp.]|jgi:DnaJ like chaperone protein
MRFIGKIAGGSLGYYFAGPFGALVGVALGHQLFDNSPRTFFGVAMSNRETKNSVFFAATFSMLGKLAKADNHVSDEEREEMQNLFKSHFKLSYASEQFALKIFNDAIESDTSFEDHASAFYNQFQHDQEVLESMIGIMFRLAYADLDYDKDEERLIRSAVEIFQLTEVYDQLLLIYQTGTDTLDTSYKILGCSFDDDMDVIEDCYHKKTLLYDPENLRQKGVPDELSKIPEDQLIRIKSAYTRIKMDRGL